MKKKESSLFWRLSALKLWHNADTKRQRAGENLRLPQLNKYV